MSRTLIPITQAVAVYRDAGTALWPYLRSQQRKHLQSVSAKLEDASSVFTDAEALADGLLAVAAMASQAVQEEVEVAQTGSSPLDDLNYQRTYRFSDESRDKYAECAEALRRAHELAVAAWEVPFAICEEAPILPQHLKRKRHGEQALLDYTKALINLGAMVKYGLAIQREKAEILVAGAEARLASVGFQQFEVRMRLAHAGPLDPKGPEEMPIVMFHDDLTRELILLQETTKAALQELERASGWEHPNSDEAAAGARLWNHARIKAKQTEEYRQAIGR